MTQTTLQTYPQVEVLNPQPSSRRNGKIARLPKETRDMINRMLDDGIPYHKKVSVNEIVKFCFDAAKRCQSMRLSSFALTRR